MVKWNTVETGGYDRTSWKARLSEEYGGLTGDKLSKAIAADGYDGIVTIDAAKNPSEIVDISKWYKAPPEVKKGTPVTRGLQLKQMDSAQKQLRSMQGVASRAGDKETAMVLGDIRSELLRDLEDLRNPAYGEARRVYREMSVPIDKYKQTVLGQVGNLTEGQLDTVAARLFKSDMNPATMRKTKQLIEKRDPQVWKDIVRVEFEKRIGDPGEYVKDLGPMVNTPGALYQRLFYPPKRRKVLYSALDPETSKNVRYLEEALDRARQGRSIGSQTAVREDIKQELRGIGGTIERIFTSPTRMAGKIVPAATGVGSEYVMNRNAKNLAKIMFDPKWQPGLKKLRGLSPSSNRAARVFRDIWARAMSDLPKPALQAVNPYEGGR